MHAVIWNFKSFFLVWTRFERKKQYFSVWIIWFRWFYDIFVHEKDYRWKSHTYAILFNVIHCYIEKTQHSIGLQNVPSKQIQTNRTFFWFVCSHLKCTNSSRILIFFTWSDVERIIILLHYIPVNVESNREIRTFYYVFFFRIWMKRWRTRLLYLIKNETIIVRLGKKIEITKIFSS